ncbi:hypothetical protein FA13DRAFT_1751073 [Coprinellus micaceus]|uniref:NudC domain-containing protein 1 n=1 Tax=Coprinellus micaceus TaxID=71717 RepID=A0A4Y7U097_COPMI|nr:hypothetical protein FA13DRAFT_1751073 [Coprinellus micaceus]
MPQPVQSENAATIHREYPCAVFVGPTLVVASDGDGSLYVLSVRNEGLSVAVGIYVLAADGQTTPFKIHYANRTSPTSAVVVVSSKSKPLVASPDSKDHRSSNLFDIRAIRISFLSFSPDAAPRDMDIVWHRRGYDVPIFATKVHIFLPSDEIAPIPRTDENLDDADKYESPVKYPPPYSWTQTSDSITVAIPLPSATTKDIIRVAFSPKTLTVHIDYRASTSIPIPRYSAKELWDTISPSSCFWTWDKEAERVYGVLTLHMEKQHEGTRWMQLFSDENHPNPAAENPDDVPETLDPSELYQIRESLEKYTSALADGTDASRLGLGAGDDEVDASVGREVVVTWVAASDGSTPSWFNPKEQIPIQLLATVLPGIGEQNELSLVAKNNLDGLVFGLSTSNDEMPSWVHSSTYPAVAFVLASKRDTRFTYLVPSKAILAFESGRTNRGGNLYVYRPSARKDKWAKQSILKVDDGEGGSLIGVGAVSGKNGELVVVCLLEGELVTIKGI